MIDVKNFLYLLGLAIALGAGLVGLAMLIVRREFMRWSLIIERIPEKSWFVKIDSALDKLAEHSGDLVNHAKDLLDLETSVRLLQETVKTDHDSLMTIKTEHNFLYLNCADRVRNGRRLTDLQATEESK
jgi:hypothetical protein